MTDTRKTYTIDFRPTGRTNIFASAMRKDAFGGTVPLDPMRGEPYVWARIQDGTLSVHALKISDEGDYEIQTHDRKFTPEGLDLTFARIRDGERCKLIKERLVRVARRS